MIQKFANPERNAEFCYVSRGRVYFIETRRPTAPCRNVRPVICEKKPTHTTIYFWPYENRSSKRILHFTMKTGLSVVAVSGARGYVRNVRITGAIHTSTSGINL